MTGLRYCKVWSDQISVDVVIFQENQLLNITQPPFACSKSAMETPEQCVQFFQR